MKPRQYVAGALLALFIAAGTVATRAKDMDVRAPNWVQWIIDWFTIERDASRIAADAVKNDNLDNESTVS